MTGFVIIITEFSLTMNVFVLNVTEKNVLSISGYALKVIGFDLNQYSES